MAVGWSMAEAAAVEGSGFTESGDLLFVCCGSGEGSLSSCSGASFSSADRS